MSKLESENQQLLTSFKVFTELNFVKLHNSIGLFLTYWVKLMLLVRELINTRKHVRHCGSKWRPLPEILQNYYSNE